MHMHGRLDSWGGTAPTVTSRSYRSATCPVPQLDTRMCFARVAVAVKLTCHGNQKRCFPACVHHSPLRGPWRFLLNVVLPVSISCNRKTYMTCHVIFLTGIVFVWCLLRNVILCFKNSYALHSLRLSFSSKFQLFPGFRATRRFITIFKQGTATYLYHEPY
jgi:hypothetical protein